MARLFVAARKRTGISASGKKRTAGVVYGIDTTKNELVHSIEFPEERHSANAVTASGKISSLALLLIQTNDYYQRPRSLPKERDGRPLNVNRYPEDRAYLDAFLKEEPLTDNLGRKEDLAYLAAGFRRGIILHNLSAEEEKRIVIAGSMPNSRFHSLSFLPSGEEKNLEQTLIAIHGEYGLLAIPVPELGRTSLKIIDLSERRSREQYVVMPPGQEGIFAKVSGKTVSVIVGRKLYQQENRPENFPEFRLGEPIAELDLKQGEWVTAVDVGVRTLYAGTNLGNVYSYDGQLALYRSIIPPLGGAVPITAVRCQPDGKSVIAITDTLPKIFRDVNEEIRLSFIPKGLARDGDPLYVLQNEPGINAVYEVGKDNNYLQLLGEKSQDLEEVRRLLIAEG